MLRTLIISFLLTFCLNVFSAQVVSELPRFSRAQYIQTWKDEAIKQMREHGIPASITLAQAILESGDGNSQLATGANNHFGIKCHGWAGKKVYHDDDKKQECFRKYKNAHGSFEDHSLFLKRSRYAFLFDYKITDYKSWAKGLKKAGYATNPKYPALLIRLIEENNLVQYDKEGLSGKKGKKPKPKYTPPSGNGSSGEIEITINQGQKIMLSDNRIKYVVIEQDQTSEQIAQSLQLGGWQIRKYNDFQKNELIIAGSRVYIQPKRGKSAKYRSHTVATGETLHTISQLYGVKIKNICKYTGIDINHRVQPGDVVKLKR